jgi:hypothetical protein
MELSDMSNMSKESEEDGESYDWNLRE